MPELLLQESQHLLTNLNKKIQLHCYMTQQHFLLIYTIVQLSSDNPEKKFWNPPPGKTNFILSFTLGKVTTKVIAKKKNHENKLAGVLKLTIAK